MSAPNNLKEYIEKEIFNDRVEFIKDFFYTLLHSIDLTYFGDTYIDSDKTRCEHFNWALLKLIASYKKRGIHVGCSKLFKSKMETIFIRDYYFIEKNVAIPKFYEKYEKILIVTPNMTAKDFKILEEIYKLFETALGKA